MRRSARRSADRRSARVGSRTSGPLLPARALTLVLAASLALAGCGGSAVPFVAADAGAELIGPPVDVAVPDAASDVGAPDLGPDTCACRPGDPCTATSPECAPPGCVNDEDCRDDDLCTADRCESATGACRHEPLAGCCSVDADCDDGVGCTLDRCQGRQCRHEPQGEGCCGTDGDCDDGFGDTLDRCVRGRCVHSLAAPPVTCAAATDCPANNPCVTAECVSDLCSYAPAPGTRCCTAREDCVDGDVCTDDFCVEFRCVYTLSPQPQPQVSWGFDEGPAGGLPAGFDPGVAAGGAAWHVTTARAFSPPASLRAGDPDGPGYGGQGPFTLAAETPPVRLPAGTPATLRFRLWLDIEPAPAPGMAPGTAPGMAKDRARIDVVPAAGGDPVPVWSSDTVAGGTTDGAWTLETATLTAWAGQTFTLRLVFTSDGQPSTERAGWLVDDVQLVYRCNRPQP
jgi:hypothetical protein